MGSGKLSERNTAIAEMLSDGKKIKDFYRFAAQNPHFDLYYASQVIIQRHDASVCFGYEEWNAMGRRITKGRKGIPYYDRDGIKHYTFDASDTHGEERYRRLIFPMRRILLGMDFLNGTERSGDTIHDYNKIYSGVEQYLQEHDYLSDDEIRNKILCEGVSYSLYSKTGFPKTNGIKLHGLPYGLKENADLFKDILVLTETVKEEIEDAYLSAQEEVPIINDIDEEMVSDEPVIKGEPVKEEIPQEPEPVKEKEKMHVSPYYQRFLNAQEENPDSVIVQRLGDFYEIMGDNAVRLADRLNMTLTGRDVGLKERVPMIGIPYHATDAYLSKILEGQSVVIIEEGEEPLYLPSHKEVLVEEEVAQTRKPKLEEMDDDEPNPFDDAHEQTDEEQPDYAGEIDTRFRINDDYGYEEDELYEEPDEEYIEEFNDEEQDKPEERQPQEKKKGKPLSERKRKAPKQFSLFDSVEKEKPENDYQSLVESLIEKELKSGSGVAEGKFRICDEYSKNPTEQEFATFLKKEYGIGGHGNREFNSNHDGRGIRMEQRNPETHEVIAQADLKWNQVAVRIADLIDDDNYLTTSEKEEYITYRAQRYGTDESRITAIANLMVKNGTRYTWNGSYNYWGFGDLYGFVLKHSYQLKQELEARKEVEQVTANGADFTVNFHKEFCRHLLDETEEETAKQPEQEPSVPDLDEEEDAECDSRIESGEIKSIENGNTDLTEIGFDQTELGGAKARFKSNIDAIETVKRLYRESREATPSERKILAKYVGWGGLAKAFDETDKNWQKEYAQLKGLLTEEEYNGAKGSVLNAHYTAKEVIDGMYSALKRFGVKGNNRILEPALGTGNFFGYMPKEISDGAKLYGVELDSLTGRIASKLYPQANVQIKGFEQTSFTNDSFDIVVTNVPFGAYSVYDSEYSKHNFYIHDYFIAKSIDKLKPNGLMAVITSKGTMDKLNPSVRKYFADRAELLGAIRLPNNAFKTTANTEVVADVLFFRKREEQINADTQNTEWLATGKTEQGYEINNYFIKHPEMVLGTLVEERGLYGAMDVTVKPDGRELSAAFNEAVERLPADFYINPEKQTTTDAREEIEVDYDVKPLCYKTVGNKLYMRVGDTMEEREVPNRPQDAFQRISGMIDLRKTIREILEMEIAGCSDEQLQFALKRLNDKYDRFVRNYGILNSQTNIRLFREDADSSLLFECEKLSDDKKTATKADVFFERTIRPYVVPTQTDDCFEALQISLNERGRVDIAYIEELTKKDYDTVLNELGNTVFRNPAESRLDDDYSGFETAEKYLSGNVKRKLSMAKTFAREFSDKGFDRNVKALEGVQPEPLSASDISVRIGASWIDKDYYKQFLMKIIGIPFYYEDGISIYYNPHDSSWRVDKSTHLRHFSDMKVHEVYGTSRASAYRIFEDCLNLKATTIYDTVEEDGREKRVLNQAETIAAREKQNKIKEEFKDWIFEDPERRDELVARYNELFNQIRLPVYDGSYLRFPEMNPAIELKPHQKNAVQRIVTGENTLLHHVVGAGKTFTICAACMKLRQYGLAKKPMIAVPNHLVQQWAGEFRKLYPNAKLLIAGKEDLEKNNRKRFVSKVALGDWDAVIIAQSSFAKIPISAERQERKLQEEISRIEETIASQWEENSHPRGAVKNLERIKKSREAQLKKLMDDAKKDDVLIFENLGVDYLFIDEAHNYKNLFLFTKMNNVAGISTTASQRASDLKLKVEFINELHGGDKGVVFATGTPISNSMTEMYTMQSYLGNETLKNIGINFFDAWAADFGETITSLEMAPSGQGYKAKTRFAKFTNLPELLTLYRSFADVQTSDMVKLDVPEVDREVIALKPSDTVIDLAEEIAERAEKISYGKVPPEIDNMLKVTSDGKKLALDPRCFEPTAGDEETSKLNACAERICEIWNTTHDFKGTQIVFCDLSTPKKAFEDYEYGKDFDVYNDLKYKLVQKGIPANEIAFIHEANTDAQKQALFDNVNDGKVRILLGSTEKCGAGTNVQKRLVALHHLDTPYRPSDMEQREGRIIRQGNENERVKIFTYVTERTFDSYSYQILENKQRFISQINKGDLTVREAEDIDETTLTYAEIKAITAANPKIKRKMEVDTEVARLRVLEGQFKKNLYALQDKIRKIFPEDIHRQELFIERTRADMKVVEENYKPDNFQINVNGIIFTDKKEGSRALMDALYESKPETVVAEYAGFKISMNPMVFLAGERSITLSCNGQYSIDIGQSASGNLTRIENFLEELPNREQRLVSRLEQLKLDYAVAQEEVKKPFEHAERLTSLLKEQTELNAELDLNKREEVIISDDKDEGDNYMALPENNNTTEIKLYEAVTKNMNTNEFRGFAGLEPIDYKERVIESVNDEFMKFQTEILAKTPEEIFSKNYEIHVKTELLDTIIGEGIGDEYYQALYQDRDSGILQQLYDDFIGSEYASVNTGSDTMEFIQSYCHQYYEDVLKSARETPTDNNVLSFGTDVQNTAYYYFKDKLGGDYDEPRITEEAKRYIIAAPVSYLPQEYLDKNNIIFLKTGRDIDEDKLSKDFEYGTRVEMLKAYYRKLPVESVEPNEACKYSVEGYIRGNFDGMHLKTENISGLVDYYGEERLNFVLANTVQMSETDGRYSLGNKAWASGIVVLNDESERRKFYINSHPAILDGFISSYRKQQKEKADKKANMNRFEIETDYGGKETVRATVELYNVKEPLENKDMHGLAIQLWEETGEPYARITTSFGEFIGQKNCAYVDVNNCPFAEQLLKQGLALDTGLEYQSGYVTYPLWQFNEEFLKTVGGENYKTYSEEWYKYMAEKLEQKNEEKEENILPENEIKNKWVSVKVSHNACLSEQEKHLFMKMPNGSEYRGYTYNVYKSRVKDSSQLVDLQSDSSELCYELLLRDNEYVILHKGDDEVELSAQEFKEIVNGTSDKDYVREEPKERLSISIPGDNIKGTYEKSSLISIPEDKQYAGYGYYVPNSFIEEDKSREDGYMILSLPEEITVTLKNKDRTEEMQATAKELKDIYDGKKVELTVSKTQETKVEKQKNDGGWKNVYVPANMFIKDYEKSNLMRMPDGKYSGYVYYFPNTLMEETRKGDFKLSLPENFTIRLKNNKDGGEYELSVDEFIAEVSGKKTETYQKPSDTKSDKFSERKKVLDEQIPQEMKNKPNWVIVRLSDNPEKGRPNKYLINVHTGKFAESDNPETWTDYETACEYASTNGGVTLAYALDGKDGIACIDLDHCIDENGEYSELAKEVLSKCGKTYVETSVSGKGLHIFGKTKGMDVRAFSKDGDMEFYQKSHFIAMTGDNVTDSRFESFDSDEMKGLITRKCEKRSPWNGKGAGVEGLSKMSDRDVVEKACADKKHGETFKSLYNGQDLFNNHSNSDMSLMNRLAYWCNGDKEQMLRIFATSGLFRPEKSPDYYEGTAIKAIRDVNGRFHQNSQSTYTPKPPVNTSGNSKR